MCVGTSAIGPSLLSLFDSFKVNDLVRLWKGVPQSKHH